MIKEKNDPMLQGINGAMTLSFVVTMTISISRIYNILDTFD